MDIKSCPFCGEKAKLAEEWISLSLYESGFLWVVKCSNCGARGSSKCNKEKAIEIWNRRTE